MAQANDGADVLREALRPYCQPLPVKVFAICAQMPEREIYRLARKGVLGAPVNGIVLEPLYEFHRVCKYYRETATYLSVGYREAKLKLAQEQEQLTRAKRLQIEREYLPADVVRTMISTFAITARARLLALPDKLLQRVPGATPALYDALRAEVEDVLSSLVDADALVAAVIERIDTRGVSESAETND